MKFFDIDRNKKKNIDSNIDVSTLMNTTKRYIY
jgi:hypothetical protein